MVSTHPRQRRHVGEVAKVLVAVSGGVGEQAITGAVSHNELLQGPIKTHETPEATEQMIPDEASARAAAPGPSGVKGTKPAPSLALLPKIIDYTNLSVHLLTNLDSQDD